MDSTPLKYRDVMLQCRDQCQAAAATIDKLVAENSEVTDQLNALQRHEAGPAGLHHCSNGRGRPLPSDSQTELPGTAIAHNGPATTSVSQQLALLPFLATNFTRECETL